MPNILLSLGSLGVHTMAQEPFPNAMDRSLQACTAAKLVVHRVVVSGASPGRMHGSCVDRVTNKRGSQSQMSP